MINESNIECSSSSPNNFNIFLIISVFIKLFLSSEVLEYYKQIIKACFLTSALLSSISETNS